MARNGKTFLIQALIISTLAGTACTLGSCSGKKTEETTNSSTDTSMGFMGRQGDTTGSDPMMGQQAPADSAAASGDTAISEVKVTPKNQQIVPAGWLYKKSARLIFSDPTYSYPVQKQALLDLLAQNQTTCWSAFGSVTPENGALRQNQQAASAGFMLRHVREMFNRFGLFFSMPTAVQNTTMGQPDTGQGETVADSRQLIEQGYERFRAYIETTPDTAWVEPVETPFFGTVSRMRLFAHVLYHNAYHAGQIGLTIARGQ